MKIYTIGFAKKSAKDFFRLLMDTGTETLIDTRLNNVSQLAGFTKRDDLEYFLSGLSGIKYRHELLLAPSKLCLKSYRNGDMSWAEYEDQYIRLLRKRRVEEVLNPVDFDHSVLLCSEATPTQCHRRLAASYLAEAWHETEVVHL